MHASHSDCDICHFRVTVAAFAALLPDGRLGVLEELEAGLGGALVLHLIHRLLDKAQQVVDVLRADEGALLVLVEVEVRVEDLDEQVEVLRLCHAYFGRFQGFAKLGHHLVALLATRAEVEVRCQRYSLRLQVLLQQLVRVADGVGAQSLEIVRPEARKRVQSRNDEVQRGYFSLAFSHFFLKNDVGLTHKLISLVFKLSDRLQVIDGLCGLQIKLEGHLGVLRLQCIDNLRQVLEYSDLGHLDGGQGFRFLLFALQRLRLLCLFGL